MSGIFGFSVWNLLEFVEKGGPMSKELSLQEMLADLERRLEFHRAQEGIHAQKEVLHRDERVRHAAEVEATAQQLSVLREAASSAETFLRQAAPLPAPAGAATVKPAEAVPRQASKMVAQVVRDWPADRSLTATAVAGEVNRRFAEALRRPVSLPTVARTLHRFKTAGTIRIVRAGVSHKESIFKRV